MMYRIGLAGHKQSGKTTTARMLLRHIGLLHHENLFSFADEIRREIEELYGIPFAELKSTAGKLKWGHLLQVHGHDIRRSMPEPVGHPNYWVDRMVEQGHGWLHVAVFDDIRYGNEADFVRDAGELFPGSKGFVFLLEDHPDPPEDSRPFDHASEVLRGIPPYIAIPWAPIQQRVEQILRELEHLWGESWWVEEA